MKRTGVFFHYQTGERLSGFPELLAETLGKPNVLFCDAFYPLKPRSELDLDPVPEDLLLQVHTRRLVEEVKHSPYYLTALLSAGGTVQAAQRMWRGDIDNAFVFTGSGDHHAGRDFCGGWCYFNGVALAVAELRRSYGARRFAIVDTDAHHGDGTWDLFSKDEDVLYTCFCGAPDEEANGKVNISIPWTASDADYLAVVRRELAPRVRRFRPESLFWNWGYDGTLGEYGGMGLTPGVHLELARLFKGLADEVCHGRLIVVLCGGHGKETADLAIPGIVSHLAELDVNSPSSW